MKRLIKDIKKSNKIAFIIYILLSISYIVGYVLFTKSIFNLVGIETMIRIILIIVFGLWSILWLIIGLLYIINKKYSSYVILMLFTIIFNAIFFIARYYIDSIYSEIDKMSKDKVTYTTYLVNMKDKEFSSEDKIGIISDTTNTEGNVLAKELISKENLSNKLYQYDDFYVMLEDLYSGKIDAAFLSSNYTVLFSSEEAYANIETDTKVVKTLSKEMDNQDNITTTNTNKKLTEPFTILVMGVDSEVNGLNSNGAFNGDTLMLITFNPKTLSATMFSMPRDIYVPISCRNNNLAKINSAAAYGTSCVINTVKNLTDIDIDYYVKVNFKGVVDLVDALGGVDVDVEEPWSNWNAGVNYNGQVCEQNSNREFGTAVVCMDPGFQTLNGEQALAYARNRHQYLGSDLDRIRHQQDVVEAIIEKCKTLSSFDEFKNILSAVQKNMDTNMTTEQILSLYEVGKSFLVNTINGKDVKFSIYKTSLTTYSLPVYLGSSTTSALGYYTDSLEEIKNIMKVNLEQLDLEPTTTFSIDASEDYTVKYYGKGIYGNKSVQTMPNLVGQTLTYANEWATTMGVNITTVDVTEGDEYFNYLYPNDYIANQSIHQNVVIGSGTNVTLYINKRSTVENNTSSNTENNSSENNSTENTTPNESNTSENSSAQVEEQQEEIVIDNEE